MGTADLRHSTPSDEGVDARGIAAFLDALEGDPAIRPHGMILLRHGAVIAEGWWAPYSADRVQLLYSLSKSFTSTAAGFGDCMGVSLALGLIGRSGWRVNRRMAAYRAAPETGEPLRNGPSPPVRVRPFPLAMADIRAAHGKAEAIADALGRRDAALAEGRLMAAAEVHLK